MRREQVAIGRKQIGYLASEPAGSTRQRPLRTILFLHAFPLTSEMWGPNLGALPEGWRGVAPDLRGFGRSSPPDPTSRMDDLAGDVVDLLDHLDITQAVVAGCSMGGYVAFEMMRSAGKYVSGLVLIDTRADADTEEGKAKRLKMIELIDKSGAEGVAAEIVPKLLGATTQRERPDLVTHVHHLILSNPPGAIRTAVTAMMERRDSTRLLDDITVPTLVVHGAEDALIPPAVGESMHKAIRRSVLEVVPLSGHLPNIEQPTLFDANLHQFLQKL
ncbi:MAG: alpha/beta fold hydrolase [Acidobacteria bacterium]|nr:alpha/beta fold hydrolase [Acidobacteriota bacterium]